MENCKKKAFEFWVLKIWIIGDLIKPFESQYIENARTALFSKRRLFTNLGPHLQLDSDYTLFLLIRRRECVGVQCMIFRAVWVPYKSRDSCVDVYFPTF